MNNIILMRINDYMLDCIEKKKEKNVLYED